MFGGSLCFHNKYQDLQEIFSKDNVLFLRSHRPYDSAIELLPSAPLPSSRIYNLSRPRRKAVENYILKSLAAGIIRPSSSLVGARHGPTPTSRKHLHLFLGFANFHWHFIRSYSQVAAPLTSPPLRFYSSGPQKPKQPSLNQNNNSPLHPFWSTPIPRNHSWCRGRCLRHPLPSMYQDKRYGLLASFSNHSSASLLHATLDHMRSKSSSVLCQLNLNSLPTCAYIPISMFLKSSQCTPVLCPLWHIKKHILLQLEFLVSVRS